MSVVIYHKGVIAADSRAVIDRGYYSEDIGAMLKLWNNPENTLVFGLCGENTDYATRAKWGIDLLPIITELDTSLDITGDLPKYMHEMFGPNANMSLLVMSKRYLYAFDEKTVYKADTSHQTHGHGNGLRVAKLGAYNGLDAVAAVKLAIKVTPECGGTVVSFKQRELTLIPKPRKKKNA